MTLNGLNEVYLYAYMTISLIICLIYSTRGFHPKLLNFIVILYFVISFYLGMGFRHEEDNYWLLYFNFLYLINYFALPQVYRRFSIPKVDLQIISLIFMNIFLINSFT